MTVTVVLLVHLSLETKMKSIFAVAVVVVVLAAATILVAADPSKPVWPPAWTATMEYTQLSSGDITLGVYMYSDENEYVALVNGALDGLCAGSGLVAENEPCVNLATQDWRWIINPASQSCCACCSDEQGCGPLNTHWIANSNSSYVDTATYFNLEANKVSHPPLPPNIHTHTHTHIIHTHPHSLNVRPQWLIQGNEANYYYETADSRIPLALNNGGAEVYLWNTGSWTPKVDSSFFDVPSFCNASDLCPGFCKTIRNF